MTELHPTKAKLIDAVKQMLEHSDPADVLVERVLEQTGISKGSLYYHFEDFPDLVETAQLHRFREYVELTLVNLRNLVFACPDREAYRATILQMLRESSQNPSRAARTEHLRLLVRSFTNPRVRQVVEAAQERLTSEMKQFVLEGQRREWVRSDIDPHAMAVFLQQLTVGRVVDEVAEYPMSPDAWLALMDDVICRVYLAPAPDPAD